MPDTGNLSSLLKSIRDAMLQPTKPGIVRPGDKPTDQPVLPLIQKDLEKIRDIISELQKKSDKVVEKNRVNTGVEFIADDVSRKMGQSIARELASIIDPSSLSDQVRRLTDVITDMPGSIPTTSARGRGSLPKEGFLEAVRSATPDLGGDFAKSMESIL